MRRARWCRRSFPLFRFDLLEMLIHDLFDALEFGHHLRVIGGDASELHPRFFGMP